MQKETINIPYYDNKNNFVGYRDFEAECITDNFYVFQKTANEGEEDEFKAYSLTIMPCGASVMHFKFKNHAVFVAKELSKTSINFNRSAQELGKDKKFSKLFFELRDKINEKSTRGKLAGNLYDFQ